MVGAEHKRISFARAEGTVAWSDVSHATEPARAVLLAQVGHNLLLLVMQPASPSHNKKSNHRQVNHGESLMSVRAATRSGGMRVFSNAQTLVTGCIML